MSRVNGFPSSEEIKKVRIGNQENEYLCIVENAQLKNAFSCKDKVDKSDFPYYLRAFNVGKIEDITLGGASTFTMKSLTKDEKISYDALLARINEAKIYADHYWENEVFTKILTGSYSFEKK